MKKSVDPIVSYTGTASSPSQQWHFQHNSSAVEVFLEKVWWHRTVIITLKKEKPFSIKLIGLPGQSQSAVGNSKMSRNNFCVSLAFNHWIRGHQTLPESKVTFSLRFSSEQTWLWRVRAPTNIYWYEKSILNSAIIVN